jgi:hypothetical protein
MYKIEIDWGFKSPYLQVVNGIVRIDQINMGGIDKERVPGVPVKKQMGSVGYKNCDALFSRCKPLVDVMVRSYFDGMRMSEKSVEWFDQCWRHDYDVTIVMKD